MEKTVDRRLELHPITEPTHDDMREVVRPNRPPTTRIENEIENVDVPVRSDREVSPGASLLSADIALEGLSPERVAELRERLESSAYSSYEVLTELAVRMLESGDLEG
jgi:hypothetical protein